MGYCGTPRCFPLETHRRRRYAENKRSVSDAAIVDDVELTAAAITRAVLPRGVGGLLSEDESRQSPAELRLVGSNREQSHSSD